MAQETAPIPAAVQGTGRASPGCMLELWKSQRPVMSRLVNAIGGPVGVRRPLIGGSGRPMNVRGLLIGGSGKLTSGRRLLTSGSGRLTSGSGRLTIVPDV